MIENLEFETLAIHAGQSPDPETGAIAVPIYQTSTFRQTKIGVHKGYEYARTGNPTRKALEDAIAVLEEGTHAFAYSSGMAAVDNVMKLLNPGDHVLAVNDLYGGSYRLFEHVYRTYEIDFTYAEALNTQTFLENLQPNTAMVWLESPTNPYLKLCDIQAIASALSSMDHSALICVDNTFATPYLQQPLLLGAHLALHSTTKYLGGHSDLVGGAVATNLSNIAERLSFLQNAVGAIPGPMDCYLTLRGLKTLAVRMDRHAENAIKVAEFLLGRQEISAMYYPGLPGHPQAELASTQMRNPGGMISLILKGGPQAARRFAESTSIFTLAESLGAVESLIEVPAAMTHASTKDSALAVDPALVRLSVGLENVDDLLRDLSHALAQ
jgi:cystathionine beta-lyase/cystathionine gamma-synthase